LNFELSQIMFLIKSQILDLLLAGHKLRKYTSVKSRNVSF
jgi:hypothetical protein